MSKGFRVLILRRILAGERQRRAKRRGGNLTQNLTMNYVDVIEKHKNG